MHALIAALVLSLPVFIQHKPAGVYSYSRNAVTTTNALNGWAINDNFERQVFFMAGRYWVFYANNADQLWRSSADGVTWSAADTVRVGGAYGHRIGYAFDGTNLHYAFADINSGDDVYYRRGAPQTDGTISWAAAEQTVTVIAVNFVAGYPSIIVDSGGYPWIGYILSSAPAYTAPHSTIITKSSANDGTWTDADGFPYTAQSGITNQYPVPTGVALTTGRTFWTYCTDTIDADLKGREWNGSSWDDEETTTTSNTHNTTRALLGIGNDVHIVSIDYGYDANYHRRDGGTQTWDAEVELDGTYPCTAPAMTILPSGRVRVFWVDWNTKYVYYADVADGHATSRILLYDESAGLPNGLSFNASAEGSGGHLFVYSTGSGAPYTLVGQLWGR